MPVSRRRNSCQCRDSYGDLVCGFNRYLEDDDENCHCLCHGARLLSYTATPPGGWQTRGEGPLFIGMECELTCYDTSHAIRDVHEALGNLAILKADGSVDGFEMVTQPLDYPYWQNEFNWDVFDILRPYTSVDSSTNGIHLHVSRSGFSSPAHVYRWMKLLYRNSNDVERIARRYSGHWSGFSPEHKKGQFQHVYKKSNKVRNIPGGCAYIATQDRAEFQSRFDDFGSPRRRGVSLANRTYEVAIIDINDSQDRYMLDFVRRISQNFYTDYRDRDWWVPNAGTLRAFRVTGWTSLPRVSSSQIAASDRWVESVLASSSRGGDPTAHTRYAAINTTNEKTYELRIFAAANTQLEVRSTVDFAAASVEYTRALTSGDCARGGWDWAQFRGWVADSPYTALAEALGREVNWGAGTFRPAQPSPAQAVTVQQGPSPVQPYPAAQHAAGLAAWELDLLEGIRTHIRTRNDNQSR